MAIAAARGPPASAKTGETITESLHVLTPARGRLKSQFGRSSKVMTNVKTLAIVVVLGLGLIFSSRLLAQEAQTGGLPALEDRVTADEALIAELETDVIALESLATRTFVFNDKPELSSTGTIVVSGPKTVTVGDVDNLPHRLVITYSSVGAIEANTATGAILFIGCFVDGTIPCVG